MSSRPPTAPGSRPGTGKKITSRPGTGKAIGDKPPLAAAEFSADERPSSAQRGVPRPYSAATLEVGRGAAEYENFCNENKGTIQFLQEVNRDIEHLCQYGELFPSNMIEEFADTSRNIITNIRLKSDDLSYLNDSKASKQKFRKVLDMSFRKNVQPEWDEDDASEASEGTMSSKSIAIPLAPALASVVQKRSLSVEPLPSIYQIKMRNKLNKSTSDTESQYKINYVSGALHFPMNQQKPPKNKQITVVTGKVNYGDLLKEQQRMKIQSEEGLVKYEKIMRDFNESLNNSNRRISVMLKPNQLLLPIKSLM